MTEDTDSGAVGAHGGGRRNTGTSVRATCQGIARAATAGGLDADRRTASFDRNHRSMGLGPVNTYLSASKMSTKWMKPMNITSSFSNRENIRR